MKQLRTKDNVHFEEPLSELISFRLTKKELEQIDVISRENYISQSELIRNLIRNHISNYAISPNLKKILKISNQIDSILLENRIVLSRNESNLSKMREILLNFEAFLDHFTKKSSKSELKNRYNQLEYLLQSIYQTDNDLYNLIEHQYLRLIKNKHLKALDTIHDHV